MTHYALTSAEGHIAILTLAPGADIGVEVAKFSAIHGPVLEVVEIDPASIPTDRTRRNEWALVGGKIALKPA